MEKNEELRYWIRRLEKRELKNYDKEILEKKYKIDYKEHLNEEQLTALTAIDGQYLVIAGAGSGKTRTIVYRTAFMLENGIAEDSILMLTFTRKAAEEMKERLRKLLGREELEVEVLTFHSLCGKIIWRNKELFQIENMRVLDEERNRAVIGLLLREYKYKGSFLPLDRISHIFEVAKSKKEDIDVFLREKEKKYSEDLKKLQMKYKKFKRENNLFSFDDLVEKVLKEVRRNRGFRKALQERYKYIVVDEYQDTNTLQRELLKFLVKDNIMVVGDDSQSIYGFRGADFENILKFNEDFPEARLIKLETNYRSTDEIIEYSNTISENLLLRYKKEIKGTGRKGEKPHIHFFKNEEKQWEYICDKIEKFYQEGIPYKEMAVLYRNRYTIHLLEKYFKERNILYEIKKAKNQKITIEEIYIKLLEVKNDPDDILNLEMLLDLTAKNREISVVDIVMGKEKNQFIEELRTKSSMEEIISWCIGAAKNICWEKGILNNGSRENLEKFATFDGEKNLEEYISKLKAKLLEQHSGVSLISCHSSKGLEWDVVFVPTLLEGIFPNEDKKNLEEEKRLFYVACTRSRKHLYLLYPEFFYEKTGYFDKKSSFLE